MSNKPPAPIKHGIPASVRVAVLAARFNGEIVAELLRGCLSRLVELGVAENRVEVHRVPGAFELPVAASVVARKKKFAAVICLGAVVRGQTPHFDFVAGGAAYGIQRVAIREGLPVIFGVLTTNTMKQAWERAGGRHGHAGKRAADAAVEMVLLLRKLR